MPKLTDDTMEQQQLSVSHYGFSTVRMEDLAQLGNEWTLVQLTVDGSGSVSPFKRDMEQAIKQVLDACRKSPRADYLLLRVVVFDQRLVEVHGFKPLQSCNPSDYDGCLSQVSGTTALFASSLNGAEALATEGKRLTDNNFSVNAIQIDITDGLDTERGATPAQIAKVRQEAVTGEQLESVLSILIGVNITQPSVGKALKEFKDEAGFTQYVELNQSDTGTLARMANFVSQSVSSQSQALGTGGPSKALTF